MANEKEEKLRVVKIQQLTEHIKHGSCSFPALGFLFPSQTLYGVPCRCVGAHFLLQYHLPVTLSGLQYISQTVTTAQVCLLGFELELLKTETESKK